MLKSLKVKHLIVFGTNRLILRHLEERDATFMFRLFTDPSWIEFIGDRHIHSVKDALTHMKQRYISAYGPDGYGLFLVERKADNISVGVCGLLKRQNHQLVDIGFAFLPEYRGKGYAEEAAIATLNYGFEVLHLDEIAGITVPENKRSISLLQKLGMAASGQIFYEGEKECILFTVSKSKKL